MQRLAQLPTSKTLALITLLALSLTVGLMFYLQVLNRRLAPYDIVAFEFAWTPARAGRMMAAWGEAGNAAARQSLWVDFAFMPAYAFLFAGVTLFAARAARDGWQRLGLWLTLAPFGAWVFDTIENAMLLRALDLGAAPPAAALTLAGVSAALKFSLLATCLLYIVGVGIDRGIRRAR